MMPDTRYALRNGDKTSTDGVLNGTARNSLDHGVALAVEGDYATCPACKAGGPVMNDCYPAFDIGGKQVLVSGARVYCKCQTKPVVLPSQISFTIEVNKSGTAYLSAGSNGDSSLEPLSNSQDIVEQYFEITDEDGQPVEGYRYDLFANGEQLARNRRMISGRTISFEGSHDIHIVMWLDKTGQERA
ncbi:PAAR domain-containing protein [Cupriavidus necator H16]|uniref:PAAR domain-containing protein n=1 Tax=Cupriavidus necator (strain ATCC 17699 / DSM 428 / KCTC 22496 / NCIMB 10442 / H16 / Stanier 337) TaxID=381666 RepID=Q0KFP6_CUPNH|nr:PAAR domain-containing protein [Cupriavidus necator]QCB99146.1 PAAR domain-containing protein [Cupriavidus necator H16]QQB78038.1 PAAR domain-containing protein [Cupriavidus necator]WKA40969.1 PAAR domain-containing protein [Cupriavidus necator]CAJ91175.1 conserved hypothetical protein [Cupriavidus necator H16]